APDDNAAITLVASDSARNSTADKTESTAISAGTWVRTDADGNVKGHSLAAGSLAGALSSKKYTFNFVGGTSADGKVLGEYTINPVSLSYDITGGHVYGSDPKYEMAIGHEDQLRNGDKLEDVISEDSVKKFMDSVFDINGINKETHVHIEDGKVAPIVLKDAKIPETSLKDALTTNYTLKPGTITYTVTPAELTVTAGTARKTYGDTGFKVENITQVAFDDTGFKNGDEKTLGTGHGEGYFKTTADAAFIDEKAAVGTYSKDDPDHMGASHASLKGTESSRYSDYKITYLDNTVTIDSRKVTYAVDDRERFYGDTVDDVPLTYGGSFQNVMDWDKSSFSDLTQGDFSLSGADEPIHLKDAGGYTINVSKEAVKNALTNPNYVLSDAADAIKAGTLTIKQVPLTVTAGSGNKTYGQTDFTYDAVTISDGFKNGDETALGGTAGAVNFDTAVNDESLKDAKANAGTYDGKTSAALRKDSADKYRNYKITYKDNSAKIDPKAIQYQVDSFMRSYGYDTTFSGHYNGVLDGDTVGGAVAESGRRMEHSVPQTAYHVDGVDTKDLLTLDAGGTYTVKADMDKAAGNIGNGNYVLDGVIDGTMTITQASLTVKAGSVEKTYGDTSFQFTKGADGIRKDGISFEGFRNGDAEKLSGLYETRIDSSIDNETANAGTYSSGTHAFIDENDKALLKNYKVTEQDGTAVIGRKDLTVTAGDARKTYGDSAFAYGDVSLTGFSNGDEAKLSGYYRTAADSTIDIPGTAVGTYRGMTHAVLEDKYNGLFSNYDVKRVDGTAVVEKAHLTVTAGTGMKSLGRDNSTFEFGPVTFTGFRNDDEKTLGGETGAGHFVTGLAPDAGIETDTPIGTYDGATVAKAVAPLGDYSNYDIGYMPGKVVIDEKKAETIVKENPSYTNIIGGITGGGSIPAIGGGEVPDGLVDIPSFEGNPANGGKDGGHETTSEPSESGANPGAKNGGQPSGNTTGAGSQGGQPIDSALQG
ncbi:MAG: MBG domain-containing protein, partial [Veillonellaceae bacterium]|nr:MBG domain-containing protein [Veillonellaceae bacterium]